MNADELYSVVIEKLAINKIHPLHQLIFEECCENVLNSENVPDDIESIVAKVNLAAYASIQAVKGTVLGGLNFADVVTLNFRGKSFVIEKDSPLLN